MAVGGRYKEKFTPKLKTWKLKETETQKQFANEVVEIWNQNKEGGTWERYKDCVLKATEKTCGWTKGKRRHGETWWWNENVKQAIDDKKRAYKDMLKEKTDSAREEYKIKKKEAKRAVAIAKREETLEVMDELSKDKSSGRLYKISKQMKQERVDVVGCKCIKDESGKLYTNQKDMAKVWKGYMEGVMNVENKWDGIVEADAVEGPVTCVNREEVRRAMHDMKDCKVGGISGIVAEHLKGSEMLGVDVMTELCNDMLDGKGFPEDWKSSI